MKWSLIGLGVVLGGLAVASYLNLSRMKEYAHLIKTTPQRIKVADLSANGPGDNPYVTLTDFRFRESDVYVSVSGAGNQKKMSGSAYFPLDPVYRGKKPAVKTPRVVVVADANSPAEAKAFMDRPSISGLVKGSTYESWITKKEPVEWSVEGRLPEKVWFVWADERPEKPNIRRTETIAYGMGLAGLVCLAIGALGFMRGNDEPRRTDPFGGRSA